MKLALLFDHFGPYHLARLRGVAGAVDALGVQFYGRSRDYAWDVMEASGIRLATLAEEDSGKRLTAEEFQKKLNSTLGAFGPDAVAIPGWSSRGALVALQWCLAHGVPAVLMTESSKHDEPRKPWKEWMKRRLLRHFAAALAGGGSHAEYLQELGMSRACVFLGYDVIDNEHFRRKNAIVPADRGEASTPPHFLASARFIEKKNLFRLLRAYAGYREVAKSRGSEPWRLVLLGDGELRQPVEELVKELQLTKHVELPGFKQYDDLPGYYARSSAFIHASTTEQWGLVVNEAMASGLPVLVSDRCGCVSELVKEGTNGFVFDPYDLTSITAAMIRLASLSGDEVRQMGEASSAIISEWGTARFGEGLYQAARLALSRKPVKPSWLDAMLITLLSRA